MNDRAFGNVGRKKSAAGKKGPMKPNAKKAMLAKRNASQVAGKLNQMGMSSKRKGC